MSQIYVLHENDEWTDPLRLALQRRELPYEEWFLDQGAVDLSRPPPAGVFYNRMSASSHTRGHRYAPEYTAAVLSWLEAHGRTVLNGSRALQLEVSKVAQYCALEGYGVATPKTTATVGRDALIEAAESFDGPFITKHNRAGKGLGVRLFESPQALQAYVDGPDFEVPVDGITLVQQYIRAPQPFITRVEMVGQKFLYAVKVDTSRGFQLCPADGCAIGDRPRFEIDRTFRHPNLERYQQFMKGQGVHVAAFEMIVDAEGRAYTYDVNTNTNYNPDAERAAGISGMDTLAGYLADMLEAEGANPSLGLVVGMASR